MESREIVSGTVEEAEDDTCVIENTSESVIEDHPEYMLIEVTQTVRHQRYEVSGDAGGSWGGGYYDIGRWDNTYVVKVVKG